MDKKEFMFGSNAEIKTTVDELVKLSRIGIEGVAKHFNIEDKENKMILFTTISYYQSLMIAYLCFLTKEKEQKEELRNGNQYFTIFDEETEFLPKSYAGKLGEKTCFKDIMGNELAIGDIVYCTNSKIDKILNGIVLKAPIASAFDGYIILLENKQVIIREEYQEWIIQLSVELNYETYLKTLENKMVEVNTYEVAE